MNFDNIHAFYENDLASINYFKNAFINPIYDTEFDKSLLKLVNNDELFFNNPNILTQLSEKLTSKIKFDDISENLSDKIHYYNFDFDNIDKASIHIDTLDMDVSYYSSNIVKKYMFYLDFISELYINFKKFIDENEIIDSTLLQSHLFQIKFRFILVDDIFHSIKDYSATSDILDELNLKKADNHYITLKFNIKNNYNFDISTLNSSQFENYDFNDGPLLTSLTEMINKINLKPFFNFNKNNDTFFYEGKILLYKYYKFLLNYHILHICYFNMYHKSDIPNRSMDPQITLLNNANNRYKLYRGQELYDIYLIYQSITFNFQFDIEKLFIGLSNVVRVPPSSNSEQLETADNQLKEIQDLNIQLDDNKDDINFEISKFDYKKQITHYNKNYLYFSIGMIIINLFIYLFIINFHDLQTSKFISFITLFITLSIYILLNKLYKFENFETSDYVYQTDDDYRDIYREYITDMITPSPVSNTTPAPVTESSDVATSISNAADAFSAAATDMVLNTAITTPETIGDTSQLVGIDQRILHYENKIKEYTASGGTFDTIYAKKNEVEGIITNLEAQLTTLQTSIQSRQSTSEQKIEELQQYRQILDQLKIRKNEFQEIQKNKIDMLRYVIRFYTQVEAEKIKYATLQSEIRIPLMEATKQEEELSAFISNLNAEMALQNQQRGNLESQVNALEIQIATDEATFNSRYTELNNIGTRLSQNILNLYQLESDITSQSTIYHQSTKILIDIQNEFKKEAYQSSLESAAAQLEAKKTIQKISDEIALQSTDNKLHLRIKLNLNYTEYLQIAVNGVTQDDDTKIYLFKNQIKLDLYNLLNVSLNRIGDITLESGSIIVELLIYGKKLISEDTLKIIYDNFVNLLDADEMNPKFYKTKYLLFITEFQVIPIAEGSVSTPSGVSNSFNTRNTAQTILDGKYGIIKSESNDKLNEISDILKKFDLIFEIPGSNSSYYSEINPFVNKEIKKYNNLNKKTSHKLNIIEKNNNIINHDFTKNNYIYILLLDISLLISFLFVGHTIFYNYILLIYIIAIIIFIYLIIKYIINIKKNVRTKADKKYWKNPKKHLSRL